jgi:hypothetical protein
MYQVRSPGSACRRGFSTGSVTYRCSTVGGGWLVSEPSRVPASIWLKMSSVFALMTIDTPSRWFDRTSVLSVVSS